MNVTRHIDVELRRSDWDVMVLHYLGLDHIGHTAGPRSSLVQPKLNEMDAVVEHIIDSLRLQVPATDMWHCLSVCLSVCLLVYLSLSQSHLSSNVSVVVMNYHFTAYIFAVLFDD